MEKYKKWKGGLGKEGKQGDKYKWLRKEEKELKRTNDGMGRRRRVGIERNKKIIAT